MEIGSTVRILKEKLDARSIKKGTHKLTFEITAVLDNGGANAGLWRYRQAWYRLSANGGIWPHGALVETDA